MAVRHDPRCLLPVDRGQVGLEPLDLLARPPAKLAALVAAQDSPVGRLQVSLGREVHVVPASVTLVSRML